uniref:hypothetical protein n=1 Tax=Paractinoplanes polyasparticus TaxID=2856853 RepID=UPI001C85C9C0|nr:hypothetical protein [Actinoplanes polyasparticus]
MSGVPGLPPDGTLMDAAAAAGRLPGQLSAALLERADDAYGFAFALVSLVAAGLVAVAAFLAFRVLWPAAPVTAEPVAPPLPAEDDERRTATIRPARSG